MPNRAGEHTSSSPLVKTIYDYHANDASVLNCSIGERFVIIKENVSAGEWTYCVNCKGKLGYIPTNYIQPDKLDDRKFFELIDSILAVLDLDHNDPRIITTRQINHAQVRLTQLRSEVLGRLYPTASSPSPNPPINQAHFNAQVHANQTNLPSVCTPNPSQTYQVQAQAHHHLTKPQQHPAIDKNDNTCNFPAKLISVATATVEIPVPEKSLQEIGIQVDLLEKTIVPDTEETNKKNVPTQTDDDDEKQSASTDQATPPNQLLNSPVIDPNAAVRLVEHVRVSTELSHEMCKLTVETVINFLIQEIPSTRNFLKVLIEKLPEIDQSSSEMMENNPDLIRLQALFKKLSDCNNDDQERGWPIQDHDEIESNLIEVVKLLANANPNVSRKVMFAKDCEYVHIIISLFSMETKKSLKMQLYSILMEIIGLNVNNLEDNLLSTVLPSSLANELINHQDDSERWSKASVLFTWTFGSGQKPPLSIYDNIGEKFVSTMLDIIEGENLEGEKLQNNIPPEISIPPILAFGLHFDDVKENKVLQGLRARKNANRLIENLVSYLNWGEDPTLLINYFGKPMTTNSTTTRPSAVHKLLCELLQDEQLSKLFYTNDMKVMLDILITHLTNSQDSHGASYLTLLLSTIRSPLYQEELYKKDEIKLAIETIASTESSSSEEKSMIDAIMETVKNLPSSC